MLFTKNGTADIAPIVRLCIWKNLSRMYCRWDNPSLEIFQFLISKITKRHVKKAALVGAAFFVCVNLIGFAFKSSKDPVAVLVLSKLLLKPLILLMKLRFFPAA